MWPLEHKRRRRLAICLVLFEIKAVAFQGIFDLTIIVYSGSVQAVQFLQLYFQLLRRRSRL